VFGVEKGYEEVVKLLLKCGANVDVQDIIKKKSQMVSWNFSLT
jgi:hypothetical protein